LRRRKVVLFALPISKREKYQSSKMDINTVFLRDMSFFLAVGKDAWQREKVQPIHITLQVDNVKSVYSAAANDYVSQSLDYGKLYKNIQSRLPHEKLFLSVREIATQLLDSIDRPAVGASMEISLPKAVLRAEGGLLYTFETSSINAVEKRETLHLRGVKCACIIGVNPHERKRKQIVVVDLTFREEAEEGSTEIEAETQESKKSVGIAVLNYESLVEKVVEVSQLQSISWCLEGVVSLLDLSLCLYTDLFTHKRVEGSSYQTVEALANAVCRDVTMDYGIPEIEVSVKKPYAIPSIGAAGIRIRRRKSFYTQPVFRQAQSNE
jgi:dihydroneopterin aldolase